jgi:hypothetical protein
LDYLWIAIPIVLIAALVLLKSRKERHPVSTDVGEVITLVPVASEVLVAEDVQEDEIFISIALMPTATAIDEARLSEISDSTVIARISQAIPAVAETATRTVANNALKNMEVYKAILPAGKTLAKSKTMKDAYRGFSRAANGDFSAQANLVRVDVSRTTAVASGVANVMNVGSLVVGQYYMSEINGRLETLTDSVGAIGDFQKREFKSRILSLIAHVEEISRFSAEIMGDDTQRNHKLSALEDLKKSATELLGQVNITIVETTQQSGSPDCEAYQSTVNALGLLVGYQTVLIAVLEDISELTYLLGKGDISAERSSFQLKKYLEQSKQTREQLGKWHDKQVKRLRIDLDSGRASKAGFDAVVWALPSLIDGKWKYRELKQGVVHGIRTQARPVVESRGALKEVYDEDVEIIIKDGKYFYLREAPAVLKER